MFFFNSDELPIEVVGKFLNSSPVDLDGMAKALGIDVLYSIFPDDNSIAGKIEQNSRGRFRIIINSNDPANRQRFTLAHEIAHFILHRDMLGHGVTDRGLYRSNLSDNTERQANRYAATLLMPAPLVRKKYAEGHQSAHGLAGIFHVSPAAAGIRMKELGLIDRG